MAKRIKVPPTTETEVVKTSRRRCCICFGLNGDYTVKKGQIAHLDGNPRNNHIDNLAFLCLNHHDEFDGKTSQSKNLTIHEVKRYREQLYEHNRVGGPSPESKGCWGKLALADTPPVFRPTPKTFATNPELVRGGRIVNIGNGSIVLDASIEVHTLDASGDDLGYARLVSAEYRVRKPQERVSPEAIAPSPVAQLLPGDEAFVAVVVRLEPDRRFESIRLMIPSDPPVMDVGPRLPIDVKVEWPSVYEERGLLFL